MEVDLAHPPARPIRPPLSGEPLFSDVKPGSERPVGHLFPLEERATLSTQGRLNTLRGDLCHGPSPLEQLA
jgi:hypothetical protein